MYPCFGHIPVYRGPPRVVRTFKWQATTIIYIDAAKYTYRHCMGVGGAQSKSGSSPEGVKKSIRICFFSSFFSRIPSIFLHVPSIRFSGLAQSKGGSSPTGIKKTVRTCFFSSFSSRVPSIFLHVPSARFSGLLPRFLLRGFLKLPIVGFYHLPHSFYTFKSRFRKAMDAIRDRRRPSCTAASECALRGLQVVAQYARGTSEPATQVEFEARISWIANSGYEMEARVRCIKIQGSG